VDHHCALYFFKEEAAGSRPLEILGRNIPLTNELSLA
jgi:hypothetical protein